ncbi:MAG: hypothetical protein WD226_01375 [Planctomycetota bacterium]
MKGRTFYRSRHGRRGMMLLSAIVVVAATATLSVTLTMTASVANQRAETDRQRLRARFLAEGALEKVEQDLLDRFSLGGDAASAATFYLELGADGLTGLIEDEGETSLGKHQVPYSVRILEPPTEVAGQDGLRAITFLLSVHTEVHLDGAHAEANRLLLARLMPVYQFAVFYDMDLEIWPGPDMTLSGRVHANGDMYVGAGSRLWFDSNYVRATGSYIQDRAHTHEDVDGSQSVYFRRWVESPEDPSEPVEFVRLPREQDLADLGIPSESGLDSRFAGYDSNADGDFNDSGEMAPFAEAVLELFQEPDFYTGPSGSTLRSGEHDVETISAPNTDIKQMFVESASGGYGWDAAAGKYVEVTDGSGTHSPGLFHRGSDLSIQVAEDGTWEAWAGDTLVTEALIGAVTTSSLADKHQEDVIETVVIDMEALGDSGVFPANGLLYLGYNGSEADSDVKGFVLTNGAQLGAPLTTVSENSVYVHGDYNTVEKKPASVIADRVNLLSNAWDGSKTLGNGKPAASETTYNLAVMSGNRESLWGLRLAGGFENLVRFHENWSGTRCRVHGSFTALWEPTYARIHNQSDAYSPPVRDFGFDEAFSTLASLPPFTPCMLQLNAVATW